MRATVAVLFVSACGFHANGGDDGPSSLIDAPVAADASVDSPSIDGPRTDWWDPAWGHRARIQLDNTKLSAGTLADFPVLVTLPTTIDPGPGGAHLRFLSDDNTQVYVHEVDTAVGGMPALAWVQIPSLPTSGPKPTFWVYYDNPTATSTSNPMGIWNARYTSVHHLGAALDDASGKGHTGSTSGNPAAVAGAVGSGRTFDGDDYIELAGENGYDYTTTMSVSVWIKVTTFDVLYQAIVTKGDSSWRLARADQGNGTGFGTTNGSTNYNLNGNSNVSNGQWHHVVGVMDGTTKLLYVDGTVDLMEPYTMQNDNNQFLVRLGMNPESTTGGARYWKGQLDELRLSSGPRTAAWIKAEFVTVSDANFAKVNALEAY